jgi:hypothetical protein
MQLVVPIASPAMLRLLWLVQLAKGVFSVSWPIRIARDARVELVLLLHGGTQVRLPARVRACTPGNGAYNVDLLIESMPDAERRCLEEATAACSRC